MKLGVVTFQDVIFVVIINS